MSSCTTSQPQRRLGTRVKAQIPVRVTSLDSKINFSENCYTLAVNPKGCGIRFPRPLEAGLELRLDELPGRGTARAKVASARPFDNGSKYWIIGVALESPGNLWCIAPAPPDWGPYSPPLKFFPASVKYVAEDTFAPSLVAEIRSSKA